MTSPSGMFKSIKHESDYMAAYESTLALWQTGYESIYIETGYGTTHVIVSGPEDGDPIMLLNGFGFGAIMWYPNVGALATRYRVYAIDVIGEFNKSIVTKDFRERRDYVNWLNELMDKLGVKKASFIGHSNGGWHALNFTMDMSTRVDKVILLAPAASFASLSMQFGIRLLAANIIRTRIIILDYCAKWFIGKGNRDKVSEHLLEQFYLGIKGFGWKHKVIIPSVYKDKELSAIKAKVLMMIGEQEVIYNYKKVFARAKKLIPHMETRLIPEVGHALNIEDADYVNREMLAFLND